MTLKRVLNCAEQNLAKFKRGLNYKQHSNKYLKYFQLQENVSNSQPFNCTNRIHRLPPLKLLQALYFLLLVLLIFQFPKKNSFNFRQTSTRTSFLLSYQLACHSLLIPCRSFFVSLPKFSTTARKKKLLEAEKRANLHFNRLNLLTLRLIFMISSTFQTIFVLLKRSFVMEI
jgi:hypothetical protein